MTEELGDSLSDLSQLRPGADSGTNLISGIIEKGAANTTPLSTCPIR